VSKLAPINKGIQVLENGTNFLSGVFLRWLKDLEKRTETGSYVPAVTNLVNISVATPYSTYWSRVDNVVNVSGRIDASIINGSGIISSFSLSLPVKTSLTTSESLSGSCVLFAGDGGTGCRLGTDTADCSGVFWTFGGVSELYYNFSYLLK